MIFPLRQGPLVLLPAAVVSGGVLLPLPHDVHPVTLAFRRGLIVELGIYWSLVMPLVRPMTAGFCLVSSLGSWNNVLGPQIYISTRTKLTLPVVLSQYMGVYSQQYGVFLAGTLLSILPPRRHLLRPAKGIRQRPHHRRSEGVGIPGKNTER